MVRLSVPSSLRYRDPVLRVVASVCRLARPALSPKQEASRDGELAEFEAKVVSAVSEAFNNVAIHAYRGLSVGTVDVELELTSEGITIRILDHGAGFDITAQEVPDLARLPESRMGLVIMRSCMDSVTYRRGNRPAGEPNVLTLSKRYAAGDT